MLQPSSNSVSTECGSGNICGQSATELPTGKNAGPGTVLMLFVSLKGYCENVYKSLLSSSDKRQEA